MELLGGEMDFNVNGFVVDFEDFEDEILCSDVELKNIFSCM